MSSDRIEKRIELKVPVSRVWRALTDYREFGQWFRVEIDGPFVPGEVSSGHMTYPGYEHVKWEVTVQKMEPERLFSFTWPHPKSFDKTSYSPDNSNEPTTLIEFRLEKTAAGTLLVLTESGFDKLPADRRLEAFRRNDGGWTEQMKNIENYVAQQT
ncbi:MAG TPA: SRPBCC family protein [Candidatus Acidoferrales bacterium]|nr:SRPBCC family protein [Candidatus Acidoferrales bacterium]